MEFFKKYICGMCSAKFSRIEDLMNHKQITHGDKRYDCRMCGKYFASMEEMRTHVQREHSYKKDR